MADGKLTDVSAVATIDEESGQTWGRVRREGQMGEPREEAKMLSHQKLILKRRIVFLEKFLIEFQIQFLSSSDVSLFSLPMQEAIASQAEQVTISLWKEMS